jgi:acetyl-CoA hydrolase/transferase-like protein
MMVTALGAAVSDTLDDGRVVSGVGGQYNLVAQAFALGDARSLMTLPATRQTGGRAISNIVWNYGQTTIPRHLRDVVITEYGVADLRGRTDRDCIATMIAITDSRFQDTLVREAKAARKLDKSYRIPDRFQNNVPERIAHALKPAKEEGHFSAFPFGSDFTEEEKTLLPALGWLKDASNSKRALAHATLKGFLGSQRSEFHRRALARLALDSPRSLKEHLLRALVLHALSDARKA